MDMSKVKMYYVGPGAEADPRVLTVTNAEAVVLTDGGLYSKTKPKAKAKSTKEKEITDA